MSSSLEVQAEQQGLVERGEAGQVQAPKAAQYQDDEGILPVILEDYLERMGVM